MQRGSFYLLKIVSKCNASIKSNSKDGINLKIKGHEGSYLHLHTSCTLLQTLDLCRKIEQVQFVKKR